MRKLHVLHATNWSEKGSDVRIGTYVLKFADGQSAELPLIYGKDIRDWGMAEHKGGLPNATVAWTGPGGLRLFRRTYENPRPEVEVATLDFLSTNQTAAPFVVAITVE